MSESSDRDEISLRHLEMEEEVLGPWIDALKNPIYLPEESAPEVDWTALRALVRGELTDEEGMQLTRLTASYRSWEKALSQVLDERYEAWKAAQDPN